MIRKADVKPKLEKRSPIREAERPLRLPGQSLQERLYELGEDFMRNAVLIIVVGVMLLWSLFMWLFKTPPHVQVIVLSTSFIGSLIYFLPKLKKVSLEVKRVKQGRDGERYVAEVLDEVKVGGGFVLHDLVVGNFNLDHVLVTRQGVFAVETKTLSKLKGKNHKLVFDGETLRIGNYILKRDSLEQAKRQARWLAELLERTTGRRFKVKPVVLFPGWYIEAKGKAYASDVWALNPKALPGFIKNSEKPLSPEDVKLISEHLKTFARTS